MFWTKPSHPQRHRQQGFLFQLLLVLVVLLLPVVRASWLYAHPSIIMEGAAAAKGEEVKPPPKKGPTTTATTASSTTGSATTWVEDEKSWNEYQGLTVVQRMEKIKATLQDGVARYETPTVMEETIAALQEALPPDLRPSLPWSALVNLMNTGLARVGWSFMGSMAEETEEEESRKQPPTAQQRQAALTEALHGVTHWLPNAALDHTATPTVDPVTLGPARSFSEYQAMWPARYPADPVLRVLDPAFPRRPYKARESKDEEEPGFVRDPHWGQRKLFMNELELLTLHAAPGDVVVYAGAAPGQHIAHLAEQFFPEVSFVLVDPAPFRIQPTDRLTLVNGLMTDDLAKEYAGRDNVLLVSDIRRTYASEDLILEDMMDQQRWHDLMQPKVSMFKFRLPWRAGKTEYLDGQVYTQPYAKPRSTETRLIVPGGAPRRQWDNQEYEEQCFFFNTVVRPAPHAHGVAGAALEATWDYAAEVEIWRAYKLKTDPEGFGQMDRAAQNQAIGALSVQLTEHIEGAQGREWLSRVDWRVYQSERKPPHQFRGGHRHHQQRREDWGRDRDRGRGGGGYRRREGGCGGDNTDHHHHRRHDNGGHDHRHKDQERNRKRDRQDEGEEDEMGRQKRPTKNDGSP